MTTFTWSDLTFNWTEFLQANRRNNCGVNAVRGSSTKSKMKTLKIAEWLRGTVKSKSTAVACNCPLGSYKVKPSVNRDIFCFSQKLKVACSQPYSPQCKQKTVLLEKDLNEPWKGDKGFITFIWLELNGFSANALFFVCLDLQTLKQLLFYFSNRKIEPELLWLYWWLLKTVRLFQCRKDYPDCLEESVTRLLFWDQSCGSSHNEGEKTGRKPAQKHTFILTCHHFKKKILYSDLHSVPDVSPWDADAGKLWQHEY